MLHGHNVRQLLQLLKNMRPHTNGRATCIFGERNILVKQLHEAPWTDTWKCECYIQQLCNHQTRAISYTLLFLQTHYVISTCYLSVDNCTFWLFYNATNFC